MLFLFNSAGDKGYVTNVLNTLYLPDESENVYQYSINNSNGKNSNNYVQPVVSDTYKNNEKPLPNHEDVLIIFVNKENIPYSYIPLRKAVLKKVKYIDDRIYFYVKLKQHCHSASEKDFNNHITKKYLENLFRTPGNIKVEDTETKKNHLGYLAFQGNNDIHSYIKSNDNSWTKTVHKLGKFKVFIENHAIFSRLQFENYTRKSKTKKLNNKSVLSLWKKTIYRTNLSYYHPTNCRNTHLRMVIAPEESLSRIENLQTKLQLTSGLTHFSFIPQKSCKAGMISFGAENKDFDVTFADKEVRFTIHRSVGSWIGIIILLILAAFSLYSTSKVGNLDSILSLFNISASENMKTVISIIMSLASAISLWGAATIFSGSR